MFIYLYTHTILQATFRSQDKFSNYQVTVAPKTDTVLLEKQTYKINIMNKIMWYTVLYNILRLKLQCLLIRLVLYCVARSRPVHLQDIIQRKPERRHCRSQVHRSENSELEHMDEAHGTRASCSLEQSE